MGSGALKKRVQITYIDAVHVLNMMSKLFIVNIKNWTKKAVLCHTISSSRQVFMQPYLTILQGIELESSGNLYYYIAIVSS